MKKVRRPRTVEASRAHFSVGPEDQLRSHALAVVRVWHNTSSPQICTLRDARRDRRTIHKSGGSDRSNSGSGEKKAGRSSEFEQDEYARAYMFTPRVIR